MFYDGPGVQRALARDLFCYVEHRTLDCCGLQRFEQSLHSSVVRALLLHHHFADELIARGAWKSEWLFPAEQAGC